MGLGDIASGLIGGSDDEDEAGGDPDELEGDLDGDDEFGDLGGWDEEEDEFDDFGESDGDDASDLEPRLDELEKEMESISSTMGTVRSENEAINETVEDIEDNIRKLLEIYEMVTRGVNPFVDDAEGAAGMGDSFGLFDGGDAGGGAADDIDTEVADADADSFFDDDWDDDEFVDDEEFDDADGDGEDEPVAEEEDGKTFDELKSEYEGGVDWSDDAEPAEASGGSADVVPVEAEGDGGTTERREVLEEETTAADEASADAESDSPAATDDAGEADDGKPYLNELPTGYGADLLVIEWLSFLRSCSSTPETFRAIRYYETIGWIGPDAADSLTQYLSGLGDGEARPMADRSTQLTVDHHTRSLGFIGQLGGADVRIERLDWTGTPGTGVQHEGGKQRGIQR